MRQPCLQYAVIFLLFSMSSCTRKQTGTIASSSTKAVTPVLDQSAPTRPAKSIATDSKVSPHYRSIDDKSPGPEVCADCHPDIVSGFLETGMGHSLYTVKQAEIIEDFSPSKAVVTHPETGVVYRAFRDKDGAYFQEESLPGTEYRRVVEASHVIGSGNHTRSYLGTVDGELIELPLTWYTERKMWDMSPGYERKNHRRFSRPVKPICLFCHNDPTPLRENKLASYQRPLAEGISCARCHGEGSAHVAVQMGDVEPQEASQPTILNPKKLSQRAQLQICQQCHLAGEARVLMPGRVWSDYDPRQPLADFMSLYVYANDGGADFGIASHGHRLSLSACAKASGDQLTCTTCHNPHRRDKARETSGGCVSCHTQDDCDESHTIGDASCSSCHMHRGGTSDIPHVTFTDHFIRKKPAADQGTARPQTVELIDILAPYRSAEAAGDAQIRLGIAHARIWRLDGKEQHREEALRHLLAALKNEPNHPEAWEELAMIQKSLGRLADAAQSFKAADQIGGGRRFRVEHAETLELMGDLNGAKKVLELLVKEQPDDRVGWGNLGNILFKMRRLDEARRAYEKSDKFGPSQALTASNRGYLELQAGEMDKAERFFNEALRRDGTLPAMYANLGTIALAKGKVNEARPHYQKALERDSGFSIAYWMLGRIEMDAKNWSAARTHLEKMIKVAPQDVRGYLDLSELAQRQGQISEAMRVLLTAQNAIPNHPLVIRRMMQLRSDSTQGK
ncbi:MAG: tetratricopeptide repeat protein [Myxococcota bacterium]|nr:tetratricopeptide repeat protein [Myxococcota bacterium]